MKINSLLESQTPSSAIANTTSSSPEFGRDDEHLEETTTSGSIASDASTVGKVQTRGTGALLKGIKTSEKFPNSAAVKEGVTPASTSKVLRLIQRHHNDWFDTYGLGEVEDTVVDMAEMDKFYGMSAVDAVALVGQELESLYGQQGVAEGLPKAQDGRYNPDGSKKKQWHQDPHWQQHAKDQENDPKNIYGNLPKKVKEAQLDEVDPRNFDSDEDYYAARNAPAKPRYRGTSSPGVNVDDEAYFRELFRKKRLAAQQAEREADHDRLATGTNEEQVNEKSKSQAQFRTMAAVAHNPKFAKKVGIKQSVGKEFHKADKKQDYKDLPKEVEEGYSDMMAKERKKRLAAAEKKKQERLAKEKENKKNKEQGVAEMDGNGSGRDGSNRKRIGSYGSRDRDITGPDVHLGSDSMMASKDMQDRALAKLTKMLSEPENMNVLKRLKTKEGVAEGWDPDTTRLEQDVRDALENGDDYTAKQYARMASTPEAKKYLLNIIKQAMYIDDLGGETNWKGVAEEKKKGADGKACWDGYRYNGTEDGKDSCVKVSEAEFTEDKLALDLYKDLQIFKKGTDKDIGSKAKDKEISNKPKDKDIVTKESFNGEYDDEAGSVESNLLTTARAVKGLLDTIEDRDNLPEWVQEKIAKAEQMLVTSWDYLLSQKEQGVDPQVDEDWQKTNKQDKTDGMSPKAVKAYRRENPGSKLQTAVTKKPSELKAGSKDAKRRKSFCARMSGNKGPMKDEKGRPTPKAKALKRWNC